MDKLYSTEEIAIELGCSKRKVQALADELIALGIAQRVGKTLVLSAFAIPYIGNRPDRRTKEFRDRKAR